MAYGDSGSGSGGGNSSVTFKGFSSRADKQNFKIYDFECAKQDLINRLSVRKGERVENPNFGTIIYDVLFEPFTEALKDQITEDITENLNADPNYLNIIRKKRLNPGQARNLGLDKNTDEYVAFLDVSTIPEDNWLEKTLGLINDKNLNGVLGSTKYIFKTSFEKCFIAATFGEKNLRTVPGAVFKRKFLQTQVLKEIRQRKEFTKKSEKLRVKKQKAAYSENLLRNSQ